jgi:hypothetical protein
MKMKTLDQIIIEFEGVWNFKFDELVAFEMTQPPKRLSFSKSEFQQRAKELGFVGRYRWGIEYKTDGKRPELADDVEVAAECACYDTGWISPSKVSSWRWGLYGTFKITDQRYKPADTSYLDKADSSLDNGADWYIYEMNVAHQPAPVGTKVLVDCHHQGMKEGVVIGAFQRWNWIDITGAGIDTFDMILVKPLDHDRKAKAERKRVVDAAFASLSEFRTASQTLEELYDKGFLRLPD